MKMALSATSMLDRDQHYLIMKLRESIMGIKGDWKSVDDVGLELGATSERVRQIEKIALDKRARIFQSCETYKQDVTDLARCSKD